MSDELEMRMDGVPQLERPIFVVGSGRSGTTLLRSMLSAHPRIAITPETHYMKRVARYGGEQRDEPADFNAFWNDYAKSRRFIGLGVDEERVLELVDRQGTRSFKAVFVAMLIAYQERVGKLRVGEKTPGHSRFIAQLLDWFPDASIVAIRRDPRAHLASMMKFPYVTRYITAPSLRAGLVCHGRLDELVRLADAWNEVNGQIIPRAAADPRVHVIAYEALVEQPTECLQQICAFLGEAFDPAMLSDRSEATVLARPSIRRCSPTAVRPLFLGPQQSTPMLPSPRGESGTGTNPCRRSPRLPSRSGAKNFLASRWRSSRVGALRS